MQYVPVIRQNSWYPYRQAHVYYPGTYYPCCQQAVHYPNMQPWFRPMEVYSGDADLAYRSDSMKQIALKDYGGMPLVVNIEKATKHNNTFRTALWTGKHFQVTVMSIPVGEDIGLEIHPGTDQFIRIEQGQALVQMGDSKDRLDFTQKASEDDAIMIPAGKWHNVTNTGNQPLKVYVIYAPPQHPFGTVHVTKAEAAAAE